MDKKIQIQVSPAVAANPQLLKEEIRQAIGNSVDTPLHLKVLRRSIDARGRSIKINLSVQVSNQIIREESMEMTYQQVENASSTCHIIGAGPGGLFAALRCLELGIKPVLIERGQDVKARRRDLAAIHKQHKVNPDSNYCFGEGGAGTYSDGKLYTRSNKRGDIDKVLRTLVYHGAPQEILVEAHPHIGTNKLPQLIQAIRESILKQGGEIHFNTKFVDFHAADNRITQLMVLKEGQQLLWPVKQVILASGHSARDVYELFHNKGLLLEAKPFALGVRVEHPQELIDSIQYHCRDKGDLARLRTYLPAASYSLVHQVKHRGVYSFCMCPGGIIAPCATQQEEVVTNGWSPSKRNNPYANSGIVVGLEVLDYQPYQKFGPLAGLQFQKELEHKAWMAGGKTQTAPAQRLLDFVQDRTSQTLPDCSYQPGIRSSNLQELLGPMLAGTLKEGFKAFGNKMRGYLSNEAVLVGVESRTSTPVRIPRDNVTLRHPQIKNLFPCGEGAGYAGGIMSAAMDGERCANQLEG